MPRSTKKTNVIDANSVNISDFCQTQGINEQIFRLELMSYLDDADSSKVCDFEVAKTVASNITASTKQLPQTQETAETIAPQELQLPTDTAPEQPQKQQNSGIVASNSKAPVVQGQAQNKPVPTALTELITASQETIELADLVSVYRNEQILQNAQSRDTELVLRLREQRIENRSLVFDQLRDLNGRQPQAPELPELPASLSDEIKALSDELGKSLRLG